MEGSSELREIKKEIIEARGLIIKSNNLSNSISADVRSVARRQASYERLLTWNSVGAYIIFAVLVFVAVQLVYNQRQASLEKELAAEQARAVAAEKKLEAIEKTEKSAGQARGAELLALYEVIHAGERQKAIDAYEKLDRTVLTELEARLLDDAIRGFRADLATEHYTKGLAAMSQEKYGEAVSELETSLRYEGVSGQATAARIQLANAQRLQGKPREAIAILQRLVEEHVERELLDDAYWFLALAHFEAHQKDEARSVLRSLMRQFPDSQYYRDARVKAAEVQLRLYSNE